MSDRGIEALEEAGRLIAVDRRATHGDYGQEAARIGALWGTLLDLPAPISPRTVAAMMVALKLARITTPSGRPGRDSWIDACGYAALGAAIDEAAS